MGWIITLISLLIQYGPTIYALVKDIIAMIKELRNRGVKTGAFEGGLRDAIARFKVSGDDAELRAMFDKLQQHVKGA